MADPAKYKSLSVKREDWKELGLLADKTNRTRSGDTFNKQKLKRKNKGKRRSFELLTKDCYIANIGV